MRGRPHAVGPALVKKEEVGLMEKWMHLATAWELMSLAFLPLRREVSEALAAGEFEGACGECLEALGIDGAAVIELLSGYADADADAAYHELRRGQTSLFVGVHRPLVTPYLGVRDIEKRGGKGVLAIGKESMAIERFMRERGVAKNLALGQSNDPVDHIGTVCEFLKLLCLVNARAVAAPTGFEIAEGDYELFLREHFVEYAAWCSTELQEKSCTPFYQAMGIMLGLLVESDVGA